MPALFFKNRPFKFSNKWQTEHLDFSMFFFLRSRTRWLTERIIYPRVFETQAIAVYIPEYKYKNCKRYSPRLFQRIQYCISVGFSLESTFTKLLRRFKSGSVRPCTIIITKVSSVSKINREISPAIASGLQLSRQNWPSLAVWQKVNEAFAIGCESTGRITIIKPTFSA